MQSISVTLLDNSRDHKHKQYSNFVLKISSKDQGILLNLFSSNKLVMKTVTQL